MQKNKSESFITPLGNTPKYYDDQVSSKMKLLGNRGTYFPENYEKESNNIYQNDPNSINQQNFYGYENKQYNNYNDNNKYNNQQQLEQNNNFNNQQQSLGNKNYQYSPKRDYGNYQKYNYQQDQINYNVNTGDFRNMEYGNNNNYINYDRSYNYVNNNYNYNRNDNEVVNRRTPEPIDIKNKSEGQLSKEMRDGIKKNGIRRNNYINYALPAHQPYYQIQYRNKKSYY